MKILSETNTRKFFLTVLGTAGIVFFISVILFLVPLLNYRLFIHPDETIPESVSVPVNDVSLLKKKAESLKRAADKLSSNGYPFLVISTSENTFNLYKNNRLTGSGLCSTGSLIHLEVDSTRSWIFETPRGVRQVRNKIVDPVWRKPDWAFIEEGLQPPSPGHSSRFERGVLGDYALDLGDGYLIHGTLYQRLLGMPVTHGCIRMNDSDLELVYKTLVIGSKVYIY